MAEITVTVIGLEDVVETLAELGPSLEARVYPQALRSAAVVVARRARLKDYGFKDGPGLRPFDRAQGRTESLRLRKTIRVEGIAAFYSGRRYKRGRAAVFAGAAGARHAYLVEAGHGPPVGPQGSPPYPFLGRALLETADEQYNAFVVRARARFPAAVAAARKRRTGIGASTARTIVRRRRR